MNAKTPKSHIVHHVGRLAIKFSSEQQDTIPWGESKQSMYTTLGPIYISGTHSHPKVKPICG